MLWYSLEAPRLGASNGYHDIYVVKKKQTIMQIHLLSGAMLNNKKIPFETGKAGFNSDVVLFSNDIHHENMPI